MSARIFSRRRGLLFALLLAGSSLTQAQTAAPVVLQVTGQVHRALALSRQEVQALPQRDFSEKRVLTQDGKEVTQTVTYRGIQLRQLLDQAGLAPDRHALRRAIVLATAQDGYQASFSWGELYNTSLGDGVVIVLRHGEDDLLERDGFPSLRSLQDTRPGPRHVRWLKTIEVLLPGAR